MSFPKLVIGNPWIPAFAGMTILLSVSICVYLRIIKGIMTKREIVNKIAKRLGLTQELVKEVVEEFLVELEEALIRGERIEIRNFGIFKTKITKPRIARNPQTGESISLPARRKVSFKPGKLLKRI